MNLLSKTACAIAIATVSASVMADKTTELSVTGQIAPGSCVPSFSGDGMIDYGDIGANTLSDLYYNPLELRTLTFSIKCSAATRVGIKPMSMRKGTAIVAEDAAGFGYIGGAGSLAGAMYPRIAGLNLDESGNKIGGVAVNIVQGYTTIDGSTNVDVLESDGAGGFRTKPHAVESFMDRTYAWGTKGTVEPLAFTSLSAEMSVQAILNKRNGLDVSKEIQLDGLVTIELEYL